MMNVFKRILHSSALLFALLCSASSLTSCSEKSDAKLLGVRESRGHLKHAAQDLKLKFECARKERLANELHVTGKIHHEFGREVDVTSRVAGRVIATCVHPGEQVHPDQPLAIIDSQEIGDLQTELLEADSKLEICIAHEEREKEIYENLLRGPKALVEAKASLEESQAQLELAQSEFNRQKELFKEKIASQKVYLLSKASLRKAEAQYKRAQIDVEREEGLFKNKNLMKRDYLLARAETVRARQHLTSLENRLIVLGMSSAAIKAILKSELMSASLTITAPASGIITHQDTYDGELIDPGKRAFVITDLSSVAVSADIPEADLALLRKGMKVEVKIASFPGEQFTGTINFISSCVDPNTRTVQIRARLPNSDLRLKENMFAEIGIESAPSLALVCSKSAIHQRGRGSVVYVVNENGYEERRVSLGRLSEKNAEIVSGLKEGEKVVTDGSLLLKAELTSRHE